MGMFDNLAKTVTVYFKTDGAEETKLELDDIAARAHDLSGDVKLGLDDGGLRARLEALKLELRAMEMKGADEQAFRNLASDFRDIGDNADGARLKAAALGLELRAIKDMTEGQGPAAKGGFWRQLFSGLSGGLIDSAAYDRGGGGGGIMGSLFGKLGGGEGPGSGIPVIGGLLGNGGLLGGGAVVAGGGIALLSWADALLSGLAAAGQGVVAFGALAYPTFMRIIAAAGLTGDRFKDLPVGMRRAAGGLQSLEGEFGKLAGLFRPDVLKLFNTGLQIAGQMLQDLVPFAKAAFKALDPLLQSFNKWLGSKQAQQFQNAFVKMSGPAITAIGVGLGKVAIAVLQLLTIFSGKDVAHAMNMFFDTIAAVINSVAYVIRASVVVWHWLQNNVGGVLKYLAARAVEWWHATDGAFHDVMDAVHALVSGWQAGWNTINHVWDTVQAWINKAVSWFAALPGKIIHALSSLPGQLFSVGKNAIQGFLNGLQSLFGSVLSAVGGLAGTIIGTLTNAFKTRSPSRVTYEIGLNIAQGLINGMLAGGPAADAAAKRIAAIITARIKAAQQYAQSVSSNAVQFAGIAGAVSGPAFSSYVPGHYNAAGNWVAASGTRPTSANRLLRNLGADASRITRFADAIRKLSNRGLDAALIAQIVAAGPDQGLDIADALLHAPGAIGRADRIENRINRASARLGAAAASAQYGGGNYNITINGGISTAHQIALEVERVLKQLRRHRGGRNLGF